MLLLHSTVKLACIIFLNPLCMNREMLLSKDVYFFSFFTSHAMIVWVLAYLIQFTNSKLELLIKSLLIFVKFWYKYWTILNYEFRFSFLIKIELLNYFFFCITWYSMFKDECRLLQHNPVNISLLHITVTIMRMGIFDTPRRYGHQKFPFALIVIIIRNNDILTGLRCESIFSLMRRERFVIPRKCI